MPRSMRPVATVPAALDAEDVLDRHQERLVDRPLGGRDVGVDRVHQLLDRGVGRVGRVVGGLEGLEGGAADDRGVVAREVVLAQELADLELDEVEQLGVVDRVDLVEEDDDVRDLDLAGQQDVLAGLGHRAVGRGHDQDRAVHLGGAGDHVLDVVGVARAVDVGVMAGVGLVLDVGDRDGDPALALLGGVVDRVEGPVLGRALQREVLGDRRRQRSSCHGRCGRSCRCSRAACCARTSSWPLDQSHSITCGDFPAPTGKASPEITTFGEPRGRLEPTIGLEPMTSSLPRKCSAS